MNIAYSLRNKLSGAVSIIIAAAFFVVVFIIDAARKDLDVNLGIIEQLRSLFLILGFIGVYLSLSSLFPKKHKNPLRLFGFVLITVLAFLTIILTVGLLPISGFEAQELQLVPVDYLTLFFSSVVSIIGGIAAIIFLMAIRDLIFIKRRKGTKRNFIIFLLLLFITAVSTWNLEPLESSTVTSVLFAVAILAGIANSFKFSWIVYLTKREKIYSIIYGFTLFLLFIFLNIIISENSFVNRSLLYYSYPLRYFVAVISIFSVIYFGMSFVVSVFHLPTAEAFDRKRVELSSLHNLSRLITRVFDFRDLVQSVTNLTIEVTEAKSAWLEIMDEKNDSSPSFQLVAFKNITPEEVKIINNHTNGFRNFVIEQKKVITVDEFSTDRRTRHLSKSIKNIGSLIGVPLISQGQMIGILYAAKNMEFGFDQEDIDVIVTFADHATIALENSRLIKESLERERLQQELMVAQKVQKKLLPEILPEINGIDLDAYSEPAYEVGGDYYDVIMLDEHTLGIAVGDVSGKGVSAAFYMAELKGIFQSLSRSCRSTKEFLIRANNALYGSIEKSAFISLIYAMVDIRSGVLRLSRAGHCPMVHISGEKINLHKPSGIGLGLTGPTLFDEVITELKISLKEGDLCVFYTDGISEAQNGEQQEFGAEKLVEILKQTKHLPASEIRDKLLREVKEFTGRDAFDDDLTIVILKKL